MERRTTITVFEHQILRVGDQGLTLEHLLALQRFHSDANFPYYTLVHNGVKFAEYVGILQVGRLTIEVLPKVDRGTDAQHWRRVLVDMIRASGVMRIAAPTSAALELRPNAILMLYLEQYITELEYLVHRGLVKKYRPTRGNINSVKGRIVFSTHLQRNYIHQERVFAEYTRFTPEHLLNQILAKALRLVQRLDVESALQGRVQSLMLTFDDMPDVPVHEQTFRSVTLHRNTQHYQTALDIARMLLLRYHPDVTRGSNDVLALMFDMNVLWERFIVASLRKHLGGDASVQAQQTKPFWSPEYGNRTSIRPDIVVMREHQTFVLDTKWKNLDSVGHSISDLHQMYVYHEYYNARKVALLYPSQSSQVARGSYISPSHATPVEKECSLIPIPVTTNDSAMRWQQEIAANVRAWMSIGVGVK